MKIKYSKDSSERLESIKQINGINIVTSIVHAIDGLLDNPKKCPSIEGMIGIPSPYRFLHIYHYYVFYRIDSNIIYIVNIYHERENFFGKLLGLNLRSRESIDYWGE